MIAPPETVEKGKRFENGGIKANQITPEEQQAYADYKRFVEAFGKADEVYFDFDIQIDTNSTLPLDKQTLANMFIRLAQMQLVDREAVLQTLNIPGWKKIVARMDQKEQMMQKGPQQAGRNPQDMAELQQLMTQQGQPGGQGE